MIGKNRNLIRLYSSKISSNHVNVALPYVGLLTSSVLSATSKQCFEQPTASFLVCSLIFIEYYLEILQKKARQGLTLIETEKTITYLLCLSDNK